MTVSPKIWQQRLFDLFESDLRQRVFLRKDLVELLDVHRDRVELPSSMSVDRFIRSLENYGKLRSIKVEAERSNLSSEDPDADRTAFRGFPRYVWGEASPFEVAISLRPRSYLSHASAVFLHALTAQLPRTVYVNKEQSPKPATSGELTQRGIDHAFRNLPV
jgi:hypothetical protein